MGWGTCGEGVSFEGCEGYLDSRLGSQKRIGLPGRVQLDSGLSEDKGMGVPRAGVSAGDFLIVADLPGSGAVVAWPIIPHPVVRALFVLPE